MSCELAESRESGRRGRRAWTFAIPNLRDGKGVKKQLLEASLPDKGRLLKQTRLLLLLLVHVLAVEHLPDVAQAVCILIAEPGGM